MALSQPAPASFVKRLVGPSFVLPALLFYIPFTVIPTLLTLGFVFFKWSGTGLHTLEFIGLDNFREILADPVFWTALGNNFSFGFFIIIGKIGLGLVTAIFLTERGRLLGVFQLLFMIPLTLSFVVISVLASLLFSPTYNLMNNLLDQIGLGFIESAWLGDPAMARVVIIIVSVWKGFGLAMLLFIARIKSIPAELHEAATVDGADSFQRAFYITIPQLRNILLVVLMLEIIDVFRMFEVILTLTQGGPNNITQVLATYAYLNGFYYSRMGYGTAISAVLLVVAGIITAFQLPALLRRGPTE